MIKNYFNKYLSILLILITLITITVFVNKIHNNIVKTKEITTICPYGAPSICFYENKNVTFSDNISKILLQFQKKEYDIIVIDTARGFLNLNKYHSPYKFVKLLTTGNLFLISTKNNIDPNKNSKILIFGDEKSTPYISFEIIRKKYWTKIVKKNITNVNNLLDIAKEIKINNSYDYYLVSEPLLTNIEKECKLKYKKSLEKIWYDKIDKNSLIPKAALFINEKTLKNKKNKLKNYFFLLDKNINFIINEPEKFKQKIKKLGNEEKQKFHFGLTADIFYEIQKKNNFKIHNPNENINDLNKINLFFIYAKDICNDFKEINCKNNYVNINVI